MSLRLGGDSAVASKALGSPMSSSFTFRTVLPRGQRWKEQSLLRNNEISKSVNDHVTSVLDREAKKEKEGQEKEEKGQGSGRDRRREGGRGRHTRRRQLHAGTGERSAASQGSPVPGRQAASAAAGSVTCGPRRAPGAQAARAGAAIETAWADGGFWNRNYPTLKTSSRRLFSKTEVYLPASQG